MMGIAFSQKRDRVKILFQIRQDVGQNPETCCTRKTGAR